MYNEQWILAHFTNVLCNREKTHPICKELTLFQTLVIFAYKYGLQDNFSLHVNEYKKINRLFPMYKDNVVNFAGKLYLHVESRMLILC